MYPFRANVSRLNAWVGAGTQFFFHGSDARGPGMDAVRLWASSVPGLSLRKYHHGVVHGALDPSWAKLLEYLPRTDAASVLDRVSHHFRSLARVLRTLVLSQPSREQLWDELRQQEEVQDDQPRFLQEWKASWKGFWKQFKDNEEPLISGLTNSTVALGRALEDVLVGREEPDVLENAVESYFADYDALKAKAVPRTPTDRSPLTEALTRLLVATEAYLLLTAPDGGANSMLMDTSNVNALRNRPVAAEGAPSLDELCRVALHGYDSAPLFAGMDAAWLKPGDAIALSEPRLAAIRASYPRLRRAKVDAGLREVGEALLVETADQPISWEHRVWAGACQQVRTVLLAAASGEAAGTISSDPDDERASRTYHAVRLLLDVGA